MFEVAADSCWTLAQQSHSQWECVSQHLFLHALHDRYREESLCDWRWNPLSGQYAQPRLGRFSTWCGLLSTALLRRLEVRVRAPADYRFNPHAAGPWQQQLGAHNQGSVNGKMRAILIDWLVRRFGGSIQTPSPADQPRLPVPPLTQPSRSAPAPVHSATHALATDPRTAPHPPRTAPHRTAPHRLGAGRGVRRVAHAAARHPRDDARRRRAALAPPRRAHRLPGLRHRRAARRVRPRAPPAARMARPHGRMRTLCNSTPRLAELLCRPTRCYSRVGQASARHIDQQAGALLP